MLIEHLDTTELSCVRTSRNQLYFDADQLRQRVDRFQCLSPDYRLRFAREDRIGGFDALFVN
ncbi:hypothetical protein, partial [Enterobacter hormaechei]|uniref:hypothetical protein n=1 Tax=Enterobacter hormaechei TaxID=158836 RepID=UPI001E2DFD47